MTSATSGGAFVNVHEVPGIESILADVATSGGTFVNVLEVPGIESVLADVDAASVRGKMAEEQAAFIDCCRKLLVVISIF